MSLNQEERSAVVTYRLEKAARTMEEAKFNLSGKFWGFQHYCVILYHQ